LSHSTNKKINDERIKMRLGSWTTIDAPTKFIDEAEKWLQDEFKKIGGFVRKVSNSHDFGEYPSFEIDFPSGFRDIDEDYLPCNNCGNCDECKQVFEKDLFMVNANDIEMRYSKKFEKHL